MVRFFHRRKFQIAWCKEATIDSGLGKGYDVLEVSIAWTLPLFGFLLIAPATAAAGVAYVTSSFRLSTAIAGLGVVVAAAIAVLVSRGSTESGWILDVASGLFVAVASSVLALLAVAVVIGLKTSRTPN